MIYRHLFLALLLCLPAHIVFADEPQFDYGECDQSGAPTAEDEKVFLTFDAALRIALKNNDPKAVAALVSFPLSVVSAKQDASFSIDDAATLLDCYTEIFSKRVQDMVLDKGPARLWCGTESAQYEDDHTAVEIRKVDTGVTKEFRITEFEFSTVVYPKLPALMPSIDFICDNPRYLIIADGADDSAEASFRYRAWKKPHGGNDKPDMEIIGGENTSAGNHDCAYTGRTFRNGRTLYTVSGLGCGTGPKGAIGSVTISTVAAPHTPKETLWCYD